MQELRDAPSHNFLRTFDSFEDKVISSDFNEGDAYLDRLQAAPIRTGTFRVGHPRSRLSRKCSFTINPPRIALSVLSARKQLAAEWAVDLRCIEEENLEIQRRAMERTTTSDKRELQAKENLIFEIDPFASDNSPLRYRNYVSLKTIITQLAITRLLSYLRDHGSNHDYMWLLQYQRSRKQNLQGDDLVRDIMSRSVEMRTNPEHTIQPRNIALKVLELRGIIAKDWIAVMSCVPEEQMLRAKGRLEKTMEMSASLGEDVRKQSSDTDVEASLESEEDGKHQV